MCMALHGHFNHYAHFSLMPISCPRSPTHIHTHFFILTETLPSLPNKPNYSITFTKPVIIPPTYHFSHYLTFILPIPITHPHLHPFLQSLSPAYHHFFKTTIEPYAWPPSFLSHLYSSYTFSSSLSLVTSG